MGAVLFTAVALHWGIGTWWPASAQAHGHAQMFGWAGLMVLGVGFHFLPRLRGAPLAQPGLTRVVLLLLALGVALRWIIQPHLELVTGRPTEGWLRAGLLLSGIMELAGATVAMALLVRTFLAGPPLGSRVGLVPILPLLFTALVAFWLSLGLNLVGLAETVLAGGALVPGAIDQAVVLLALYAFLVPISVTMSARTFALYFRTPLPRLGLLQLGLGLLLGGLALRLYGDLGTIPVVAGAGRLGLAGGLLAFVLALGVFAPRRPLPRQPVRPFADPVQMHAISSYVWLSVAIVFLVLQGMEAMGAEVAPVPVDGERHVLGAGFVTLLILGMAQHLLPGFGGRPVRSRRLIWATLALGNAAALLRVAPLLVPVGAASLLLALAGVAGWAAVLVLAINLLPVLRRPRTASVAG